MFKFSRIHVEITNICFLNCTFCPNNTRKEAYIMPLYFFENICEQVCFYTKTLALHILGDPLALENLSAYLDIAHKYNLGVILTTVGLNLALLKQCSMHPALKQINFSLTSFIGDLRQKNLDEYLYDIIHFCHHIKNEKIFINLRFWNQESLYYDKIIQYLQEHFPLMYKDKEKRIRLKKHTFLCLDSLFVWPSLQMPLMQEKGFCLALKTHIGILVDGRVVPCCLDYSGVITLGNIHAKPLRDILHSKRALNMYHGFLKGQLTEELCKHCSYIQRFRKAYK